MKNFANKFLLFVSVALAVNLVLSACKKDFLEVTPTAALTEEVLSSKKGLDGLLIGCYSVLTGRDQLFYSGFGNWFHGSILGGEANKGTNGGDQAVANPVQRFETLPNNDLPAQKWRICYEGVARCNTLLRLVNSTTDPTVTPADKTRLSAEARFLRGFYYFELKKVFGSVPYVDETMTAEEAIKVPNNVDIYPKIEADFQYAADNLPETQAAVGRANSWAAKAFLAKVYLFQKKYGEARTLFTDVIANGKTSGGAKYALVPNYADFFKAENDNNSESVFAAQTAVNTGSTANANGEHVLNFPYNTGSEGPAGCCGFFQPSFDLVNSFRVDANGLPLLDGSYNDQANEVKSDWKVESDAPFTPDTGPLDPRLDHSVGRRGIPYLDWIVHPGKAWIRDQDYAGPYSPKKFVFYKGTQSTLTDGSSWTRGWTAINQPLMRFADVLLMAAECEAAPGGNLEKAREYVNMVRARAANPASWVKNSNGSNAANYVIGLYNTPWTDAALANAAIRMERKLELSGEGHRFYDLVRWGIADEVLDAYLAFEGARLTTALGGATFTPNQDELYPIPQTQIDIQGTDVLKQNPGY
ncbi:MAG: RagB/SusD family nutrient uptake outer membrane protein [Saprospiraceae bacterium]